jgi:NAD(P)-dependent dehydrogenase (short-subunit alcohol dehydrogenase family)
MIREVGVGALVRTTDISSAENCAAAVDAAVAEFGRLDALCNVAGIIFMCNAQEMPVADWQKIVDVNLSGPFYLMQAAIPHLLEVDGAVVNVTSSAAFIGEAYAAAYCATKAGLNNLTRALAMEFTRKPIRFNAVAPGGMVTNIANALTLPEDADLDLMRRYTGLRGTVEVDDVADVILMLASDAGRGYHGACISIDKGITAG